MDKKLITSPVAGGNLSDSFASDSDGLEPAPLMMMKEKSRIFKEGEVVGAVKRTKDDPKRMDSNVNSLPSFGEKEIVDTRGSGQKLGVHQFGSKKDLSDQLDQYQQEMKKKTEETTVDPFKTTSIGNLKPTIAAPKNIFGQQM